MTPVRHEGTENLDDVHHSQTRANLLWPRQSNGRDSSDSAPQLSKKFENLLPHPSAHQRISASNSASLARVRAFSRSISACSRLIRFTMQSISALVSAMACLY